MDGETPAQDSSTTDDKLFKNVIFYITGDVPDRVLGILRAGGAEKHRYLSDYVTHVICGPNSTEDDLSSAKELYEIPAVRWKWVSICSDLKKLVDTEGFIVSETNIFYKMIFCFSNIDRNDRNLLWGLVTYFGGEVELNLTHKCTHLITTDIFGEKYKKAISLDSIHIITPDWLLETIANKSIVSYETYHPRLLLKPPSPIMELSAESTTQITGFETTDTTPINTTSQSTNEALLKLKQRMPWNQPLGVRPQVPVPVSSPLLQTNTTQHQTIVNVSQHYNTSQNEPIQSTINQSIYMNQNQQQTSVTGNQVPPNAVVINQNVPTTIVQPGMQSSLQQNQTTMFRSQLPVSTIHQQMSQNQLSQQHIQAGLQRQHMLQNSIAQQQLVAQQQQNDNTLSPTHQKGSSLISATQLLQNNDVNTQQQQVSTQQQFSQLNHLQIQQKLLQQNSAVNKQLIGQQTLTQQQIQTSTPQQLQSSGIQQPHITQQIVNNAPSGIQQQIGRGQIGQPQLVQQQIGQPQLSQTQINQSGQTQIGQPQLGQQIIQQQIGQQQITPQQLNQQINRQQINQQVVQQQVPQQVNQQQISQQQISQQQINQQQINQQQINQQQISQHQVNQQQINQQQIGQPQIGQQQINQQQITSQIGQPQIAQGQVGQLVQTQVSGQNVTQSMQAPISGIHRLPTNPIQRQQLIDAQTALANKQIVGQQQQVQSNEVATNEAMLKQQRLLQQQQQLRIQQLQNQQQVGINNQFVVQQQGNIVRTAVPAVVKQQVVGPGGQFVQPTAGQQRPVGWQQQNQQLTPQQQQQQQIFLQQRQAGLQSNIQRPPNWPQGQQPGVIPQRQFIHLDAQTNAQLQQMDPIERAVFVQKIQKRHLLMQRQVQNQQFAVIRGQVVPGQAQGAQWQQPGTRPTLVVQQAPGTPNTTAIRLPQKQEDGSEQPPLVVNAKTKTALANMLSIRLQSGGAPVDPTAVNEPSAAGTLRLMTAQHHASLQQQQQRRTLTNGAPTAPPVGVQNVVRPPVPQQTPQTPPRAHFYGHNPNLKLPPNLFLLGCVFVVVEVESFLSNECPTWRNSIRKYGGEIEPVYCQRVTHVLCQSQKHGVVMQALRDSKRCVTIYWLSDVLKRKQVAPPWLAIHLPTLYPDESPGARHLISTSGFNDQDRAQVKLMISTIGARFTSYFSKHNTILICAKPEGNKYNFAKKCGVPVVNVQWLSDIMMGNLTALHQLDHARYQQFNVQNMFSVDYSLNPPLMHGWKMPINITQESYERVKRNAPPPNVPKPKKPKLENMASTVPRDGTEPRILFSQVPDPEQLEAIVGKLGGSIATSAKTATHLVMPKLARSNKLLQCIAKGAHILPDSWLRDSDMANKFVDETNHTFANVEEFNKAFDCDFYKIFTIKDRHKLFQNRTFYLTPSVFPPKPFLKEMIELSGGVVEDKRRSFSQIEETNKTSPQSYIILTHKDDLHLVNDCLVNANSGKKSIVFNTEFALSGILKQQLLFDENNFAVVIVSKRD